MVAKLLVNLDQGRQITNLQELLLTLNKTQDLGEFWLQRIRTEGMFGSCRLIPHSGTLFLKVDANN